MARKELDVWLYGVHIARLSEPSRFRYRLDFTDDALDAFGEGSRVLSLALPISRRPISDNKGPGSEQPVSAFPAGLLPEGNVREQIAAEARVAVTDSMELLRRFGAECVGAVEILDSEIAPGPGHIRPLTDDEIARLIEDLPTYHLPGRSHATSVPRRYPRQGATHCARPRPLGLAAAGRTIDTHRQTRTLARHGFPPHSD